MREYEQQIAPDRAELQAPEELHPISAAFGGDIGEALEKGGGQVASRLEALSSHLARMNYYRDAAQRADLLNQYKTQLQTKLYGDPKDPNATVTQVGGQVIPNDVSLAPGEAPSNTAPADQTIEVPAAVYQRNGYAASGAIQDVDTWHNQASAQIIKQGENLGLRNFSVLKSQMDSAWSAERMSIVKHEATQVDAAQQKTFLHGMQLDAENAVTKQDPVSLSRTIDSINQQNTILNDSQHKDADDPIRELTSNKFVSQALNNSMLTNLRANGGDPTQFQGTLEKLHDDGKINDTVYENAGEHLDKTSKSIINQNAMAVRTQTVNSRMNTMDSALKGKLDLSNPNILSEIAANDPKLGEALTNYSNNKDNWKDSAKDEDANFEKATENIFSAGSKEQISGYMMNVLKEGNISQDRLNILAGAAMDRGKSLADLDGQSKSSNPVQNLIDGGVKAISKWNKEHGWKEAQTVLDFLTGVKNKPVSEAYNQAVTNSIVRNNPGTASMATPPNMVIDKTNDIKYVFPRTNRKDDGSDTNK